jgi:hypothetical protein
MDCTQYQDYYYSFIEEDYQAIPPEQLEHLRSCPVCLEQIEKLKQTLGGLSEVSSTASHDHLALHFRLLERAADCASIKPLLPCLAMASLPIYVRTPATVHLEACPACRADYEKLFALRLTDVQLLRASRFLMTNETTCEGLSEQAERVLSAVRKRPSSGVLTYATFPVQDEAEALKVETIYPSAARMTLRPRRSLRIAAAGLAAAVLMVGALLFVGTPSAGALDLHQFYEALAGVQNLSIQTIAPEETEPVQTIWISQTQGVRLFKSPEKSVLYDLNTKTTTLRDNVSVTTRVETASSTPPDSLQLPWGLLPFRDVKHLAKGFQWKRLDTLAEGQIVVYELSWTEPMSGQRIIEKKWVGYLDKMTHLPERIEWYERFGDQAFYRLLMKMVITYPETETVLEAVRSSGL